jgi:hypothetical protein
MPANRRRNAQAFPLAYVCAGIAILVCVVTFSIRMLMINQELKQGGERLRRIRNELTELSIKIEALQTRKTQLTSAPALQQAIKVGTIKLVPIEARVVVDVGSHQRRVATAETRIAAPGGR